MSDHSIRQFFRILLLGALTLGTLGGIFLLVRSGLPPKPKQVATHEPEALPAPPGAGAVGLVYPAGSGDNPVVRAYSQVLREEGFQLESLTPEAVGELAPDKLRRRLAAVVLPEEVNTQVTPGLTTALARFVREEGGALWLGQDAGRGLAGATDSAAADSAATELLELAGVAYAEGGRARTAWHIPADSPLRRYYDEGVFRGDLLRVYPYPPYEDRRVAVRVTTGRVLATGAPLRVPVAVERDYPGGGAAFYLNGRPGRAKYMGNDDLVLRGPLKYLLLEKARAPRLVGAPGGVGGLALSIHICAGTYNRELDRMLSIDAFRPELPITFSITAGPDNNHPGDGTGFDADNPRKGGAYVKRLATYGSIGAQGGWIHNYWAANELRLAPAQRERWIHRNFESLRRTSGQPVIDYAAPGGAHTTDLNDYLAAEGARIAAIPTSYNAPPTHAWFGGKREDRFWVLGYSGTRYGPAVENMLAEGRSPHRIAADVAQLFEEVAGKREIRLFYSHPFELATRPELWQAIQDSAVRLVREGRLSVRTMGEYARFLDRRERTEFKIRNQDGAYVIEAAGPETLRSFSFALPVPSARLRAPGGTVKVRGDANWSYVTVTADVKRLRLRLPYSSSGTAVGTEGGPSLTRSSRRTN